MKFERQQCTWPNNGSANLALVLSRVNPQCRLHLIPFLFSYVRGDFGDKSLGLGSLPPLGNGNGLKVVLGGRSIIERPRLAISVRSNEETAEGGPLPITDFPVVPKLPSDEVPSGNEETTQ